MLAPRTTATSNISAPRKHPAHSLPQHPAPRQQPDLEGLVPILQLHNFEDFMFRFDLNFYVGDAKVIRFSLI